MDSNRESKRKMITKGIVAMMVLKMLVVGLTTFVGTM